MISRQPLHLLQLKQLQQAQVMESSMPPINDELYYLKQPAPHI